MLSKKKLPPYGQSLLQKHLCGRQFYNEIFIFWGTNCWAWGKKNLLRPTIVLPDTEEPNYFSWQPIVRGREILLWLTGNITHDQLRRFAYLLLKESAVIVRVIAMNCWNIIAVYRKETGGGKNEC
jgi:hypothetical protein